MIIFFCTAIASLLSGMSLGGGNIVIMFLTNFNILNQKQSMIISLIIYIFSGISIYLVNIKKIKKIKIKRFFIKIIPFVIIGNLFGIRIFKNIGEESLKKFFNYFMLIIGIYEIISSLKNLKKGKI